MAPVAPVARAPGFRALVSVCALVALPLLVILAAQQRTWHADASAAHDPSVSPGLVQNGHAVTNIFACDANGQPLAQVQLFDQHGNPVNVLNDPADPRSPPQYAAAGMSAGWLVPSGMVPGGSGWNVYPLGQVSAHDIDYSLDAFDQVNQANARPVPVPTGATSHGRAECGGAVGVAHSGGPGFDAGTRNAGTQAGTRNAGTRCRRAGAGTLSGRVARVTASRAARGLLRSRSRRRR